MRKQEEEGEVAAINSNAPNSDSIANSFNPHDNTDNSDSKPYTCDPYLLNLLSTDGITDECKGLDTFFDRNVLLTKDDVEMIRIERQAEREERIAALTAANASEKTNGN